VLEVVLGDGAKKLTPSVLSELKKSWTKEFDEWNQRDLAKVRFTYLFADGIYQEIRGDNGDLRAGADGRQREGKEALDRHRGRD
jgi:transposase-like protein